MYLHLFCISFVSLLKCTGNFVLYFALHYFMCTRFMFKGLSMRSFRVYQGGVGYEVNCFGLKTLDQVHVCCVGGSAELNAESTRLMCIMHRAVYV